MPSSVVVWKEPTDSIVPKHATTALAIAGAAVALNTRDQKQIITAFESGSFEMMAGFVLNKALSRLKRQLASLGMEFVGEMLGRPDLDDDSVPTVSISNYEAIGLARELGIVKTTDATRLTQHLELLAHFDSLQGEDAESAEMNREEALSFLRTCVNSVLGREGDFTPIEFKKFRSSLEETSFKETDADIQTLISAPYFFKRTTISILLSDAKTQAGAKFEHTVGNILVLIPKLWEGLRDAEKWSVGQAYAEAVNAGRSAAVLALRKALTTVHGFDYVPESLRSQTFTSAASNVISIHTAMNNFYNEPTAIAALAKLGSTIPWPAYPICMSATLAVRLGNRYGTSHAAQESANLLLNRLTKNQWDYYLNECLAGDELVLQKLAWYEKPRKRWIELVAEFDLAKRSPRSRDVQKLLQATADANDSKMTAVSANLLVNCRK